MTFGELPVGKQFYFEQYHGGVLCVKQERHCVFEDSGSYRFASDVQGNEPRLSRNDVQVRAA